MIYPIVLYGNPILKQKAREISKDDIDIKKIIRALFDTMYAAGGVGLAAPQVGKDIRVFVMDSMPMEEDKGLEKAFINPVMLTEEGAEWMFEEGCLSIPDIREKIERKPKIKIRYMDEHWNVHEENYEGIQARIIQHEYDHLEGVLFTDYLSPLRKRLINKKLLNISKGKVNVDYTVKN